MNIAYPKEYYTYFLARARHHVVEDMLVAEGQEVAYYGYPNVNQESCSGSDVDLCPTLVLTIISAFGAAALFAMYVAATQNNNGKRKRRRSLQGPAKTPLEGLGDLILYGKERLLALLGSGRRLC